MVNGILRTTKYGLDSFSGCSLTILMLLLALFDGVEAQSCDLVKDAEDKLVEIHNDFRAKLAKKELPTTTYGNIKGSTSLFKLTYDCAHENLALAMITKEANFANLDYSLMGKGVNVYKSLVEADPTQPAQAAKLAEQMEFAVKQWAEIKTPLSEDVIYKDERTLSFANMVNYRALKFGCRARWHNKQLAIACVYSSIPKEGEVIYLANTNAQTGCKADSTCKKVVKNDGACDPAATGLCTTAADVIDSTTMAPTTSTTTISTSTSSQQSSAPSATTTPTTKSEMTAAIRDRILVMHNWRRSELAKGNVRNGKVGKANFRTAMNMNQMRYDMNLESQAQTYADTCQRSVSPLSSRQDAGENIYVSTLTTVPALDVVVEGIKSWWKKIRSVGINYQMLYTQNIENKANAPIEFTQMAWAASYKIGCAVSRCDFGTVLVCRYNPRGNIQGQHIYQVGSLCASCSTPCNDGLCTAPA